MILPYLWTKDFTSSLMAHNQSPSLSNTVGFNFKITHKIATFLTFSDSTFFFFWSMSTSSFSYAYNSLRNLFTASKFFHILFCLPGTLWLRRLSDYFRCSIIQPLWIGPHLHSEQEPILFRLIFPLHIELHSLFLLTYFRLLILILHALLWGHCFLSDQLSLYKHLSNPLALFYWLSMWLAAILSSDQRLDTTFAMNTSLHSHKQY